MDSHVGGSLTTESEVGTQTVTQRSDWTLQYVPLCIPIYMRCTVVRIYRDVGGRCHTPSLARHKRLTLQHCTHSTYSTLVFRIARSEMYRDISLSLPSSMKGMMHFRRSDGRVSDHLSTCLSTVLTCVPYSLADTARCTLYRQGQGYKDARRTT